MLTVEHTVADTIREHEHRMQAAVAAGKKGEEPSGVIAGGSRATVKSLVLMRTRSMFHAMAFKAFNPSRMCWAQPLHESSVEKQSLLQRMRLIKRTQGYQGLLARTLPVFAGNYMNSIVLFGTYACLCDVPLSVMGSQFLDERVHHDKKVLKSDLVEVIKAGAVAGAAHGSVAATMRLYLQELRREQAKVLLNPKHQLVMPSLGKLMISQNFLRRSILGWALTDALAYGAFFGMFEYGKMHWLHPLERFFEDKTWATDKELWVISTTAVAAGGAAGVAHRAIRTPGKWVMQGNSLLSRALPMKVAASVRRSVAPNALTFLIIEVILYKSGIGMEAEL